MTDTPVLTAARQLHQAGCSVIPVALDGTKRPNIGWKPYTAERPELAQLETWFGTGHPAVGVVCGAVSGNLEMLELEGRAVADGLLSEYTALITDHGLADTWKAMLGGYLERTPSGGIHVLYRIADGAAAPNTKLARRPSTPSELAAWKTDQQQQIDAEPDDAIRAKRQARLDQITDGAQVPQVLLETRGEGGFVVVAPTTGTAHPSGQPWTMLAGGPATIATITAEQRDALFAIANMLDQMPAPVVERDPTPMTRNTGGGISPGDDFNQRATWDEILTPHGWKPMFRRGQTVHWTRPGKGAGTSATTGYGDRGDYFYAFTSSTELPTEKGLSKFATYTYLEHAGDFTAAAKKLKADGYGRVTPPTSHAAALSLITPATSGTSALSTDPATTPELAAGQPAPTPADDPPREIDVTNEATAITNLIAALDVGAIPDTYVRYGRLVRIGEVSGPADPNATAVGPNVDLQDIDADMLRRLLAQHTNTYRWKANSKKAVEQGEPAFAAVPTSPAVAVLKSALTETRWASLPTLTGIATAPILRPDGTLLQTPGYDHATGMYYSPALEIPPIPETPGTDLVAAALTLIVDVVLGDFPWKDPADLANYIALLVTPILRPYIGGLSPLGAISASERGSGKTLLTTVIGQLYRMTSRAWVSDDDELRKSITAVLSSTKPVVLFDNVGDHDTVAAPSLAKLLTSEQWDDRLLGRNTGFEGTNDRLWLVTGNSIEFGGDIAERTVLVRLDPKCPDPSLRSGFTIPDLQEWIEIAANRAAVLHALLVLCRSWIAAGAPREEFVMRGYKRWVCAMGGFLAHHGITKFLANREELKEHDEEGQAWAAFFATWYQIHGTTPLSAAQLRKSADPQFAGFGAVDDPWSGTFITKADGTSLPSANGLGMMLKRRRDRFYGGFNLRGEVDSRDKVWRWAVFPVDAS